MQELPYARGVTPKISVESRYANVADHPLRAKLRFFKFHEDRYRNVFATECESGLDFRKPSGLVKVEHRRFCFVENVAQEGVLQLVADTCVGCVEQHAEVLSSELGTSVLLVVGKITVSLLVLFTVEASEELIYLLGLGIQLTLVFGVADDLRR